MKTFMINYDLNKSGKDYEGLYKALRAFAHINAMDSVWFVKSNLGAQAIYDHLTKHIDANDYLLVSEFSGDRQGWMKKTIWDWLNQYHHAHV